MTKAPKHSIYLGTLQRLADESQRELATLMPHHGERGRIVEEIIKNVLHRILPRRFSIGTGIIISSAGDSSAQTDIVIYDNFLNSPLLSEFGVCLFPVETVYATIEVKTVLTKKEIRESLKSIGTIRKLGSSRHYVVPGRIMENNKPRVGLFKTTATVPPRSYILSFRQRGLGPKFEKFKSVLRECLDENDMHVHGVCVLGEDWFAGRRPYKRPAELFATEGNALLSFYRSILKGQQNFSIHAMDLDAYLGIQE